MPPAEVLSTVVSELFERDEHGKPIIPLDARSVYTYGSLIRKTEELLLRLFGQGLLSGTTHTCLGQELCQMSVVRALTDPKDVVLSNHRNHGHFLTYSGNFLGLVGEIMGRECGVCGGAGGSQHIAYRHFHSNGVQAGMTGIGIGEALAIKRRGEPAIVATIVGDGTLGEGLLYESMNLASIWGLPVLFVVENNHIAQTTPTSETIGGSIECRGPAFGLDCWSLDDSAENFLRDVESVVLQVRSSRRPGLLVIETMRMGPHSKGDDLRSKEEMEAICRRDPLSALAKQLSEHGRREIDALTNIRISEIHKQALESPEAAFREARRSIFVGSPSREACESPARPSRTVRESLNESLRELLEASPEVIVLGEDLHDPYGGAFKVTAGLNAAFPDRVISTPISEAGVAGAGIGLALAGFRPIVEIMFADFVTLAMDQIFNHAVKFPGMFPGLQVPLVIRTPSGGRRGYGPTHSQSPENLLASVPGLTVLFASHRHNPGEILKRAVLEWPYPTVAMEHKLLYGRTVDRGEYRIAMAGDEDAGAELFPTLVSGPPDPDLTIVCYGDAVHLAEGVAARLVDEDIEVEIVAPSLISPLPRQTLMGLLLSRPRVLTLEEAPRGCGFGSELGAALLEGGYRGRFARVAPPPVPIPAARSLESSVLPDENSMFDKLVQFLLSEIVAERD